MIVILIVFVRKIRIELYKAAKNLKQLYLRFIRPSDPFIAEI